MVPPLLQNWLNANAIDIADTSVACVCGCVWFFEMEPGVSLFYREDRENIYNNFLIIVGSWS